MLLILNLKFDSEFAIEIFCNDVVFVLNSRFCLFEIIISSSLRLRLSISSGIKDNSTALCAAIAVVTATRFI